jgi:hypothetical protein
MSKIRRHTVIASALALAACAPAPMKPEVRSELLANQAARLASTTSCCNDWKEVDFARIAGADGVEVDIGARGTQVRTTDGAAAPVVGFRLPPHESRRLEFRSYSDRGKIGRMDDRLFIRPDFTFLDADFAVLETVRNPALCMGYFDEGAALWTRVDAPGRAAYVVLSPSVAHPTQMVDTRVPGGPFLGPAGNAIVDSIADARQSYIATATMGYLGKVTLQEIGAGERPHGRCVVDTSH